MSPHCQAAWYSAVLRSLFYMIDFAAIHCIPVSVFFVLFLMKCCIYKNVSPGYTVKVQNSANSSSVASSTKQPTPLVNSGFPAVFF